MSKNVKRLIPFIILLLLVLLVYLTNFHEAFSLSQIQAKHDRFVSFVQSHPILSPLIFIGIYILSVCLIIPDSTILSLLAGLVFPLPLAILYIIFSEVVGGVIFFAIFRGVFGNGLIQRERPFINNMRLKFQRHDANYLLFLRLSHIFPFWVINLFAAYFNVSYKTFIWTCVVGVIPLSGVLAFAGHSLSKLFAENRTLTLSDIFTTEIKLALLALGLLALVPIIYQNFIGRKKWK